MQIDELLRRRGGAARTPAFAGVATRRQLERAVLDGAVLSPAPGLFQVPDCRPDTLAAAAVGGVLSCGSAARDHGLPLVGEPDVHVVAPRGSTRTWPRCRVHRRDTDHDGFRTTVLQTVVDCFRCLTEHEAVGVGDHCLRHALISAAELERVRVSLRRSDPVRGRMLLLDGRADSPPESWARVFLLRAGYSLEVQEVIPGVGRTDIVIDGWLVVEIDGAEYHRSGYAFANDRRRDRAAYPQGYVVIRFPALEVLRRAYFLAEVEKVHLTGPPRRR